MLIAIDFDETLTKDASLWRDFIASARERGHRVVCVTARRPTEDNWKVVSDWLRAHGIHILVFFTELGSKVEYMQKMGHKVDVWIDDDPRRCAMGW